MDDNKKLLLKDFLKRGLMITIGCILYPVGVVLFLQAGGLATGGATGIALIVNKLTGFSTGVTAFLINIPLMLWGLKVFGRRFFLSTLYVIALSSALTWLTEYIFFTAIPQSTGAEVLPLSDNGLVNAVTGGAVFGFGMGLIFRGGASSGGTDIPVKVLRKAFRHISTGTITLITDVAIIACSAFAFRDEGMDALFFTVLSVVVFTVVFDMVLYGGNSAKMVLIISERERAERMSARILTELDGGATFIEGRGAYSGADKAVLLSVVKPVMYPRLRDIVREEDGEAFMIVCSAKEIYGEGYMAADEEEK